MTYNRTTGHKDIAIIGMGCIFPKSNGLKEYWRLLFNGEDAIGDIPETSHWRLADYHDEDPAAPDRTYCRRGGFLSAVTFDPLSYGIPPNNLESTDTSQLLGLLTARMALEDAGYPPGHLELSQKTVNVILGVTGTQELVIPLGARLGHPLWKKALADANIPSGQSEEVMKRLEASYVQWQENSFPGLLGNVVAGRIANRLDLCGTNSVSDAACASSLSALHTAVMELVSGKCDMSITGGVDTLNDIFMHMCFSKTGVLSHTSDARPFSAEADGTVLGEGIGMLVLKRLEDAVHDNNRIYAVIKGVGTSSDGRTAGIYTPDARGQERALKNAYEDAGVAPTTVGLIEAHGTGTRVGDKVEFNALKSFFAHPDKRNFCALGSVKSMIGHTKAAAGVAGIIKAALALHHKVLLPTLKAETPDPQLDINNSPFYLCDRTRPWAGNGESPRRAGVSAFGFGGSNFHVVLEEHEGEKSLVSWDGTVQIAAFSGQGPEELVSKIKEFQSAFTSHRDLDSREKSGLIAWHTGQQRNSFNARDIARLLFVIKPEDDVASLCDQALDMVNSGNGKTGPIFFYHTGPVFKKLGFLFPGQGSQYVNMGRELFAMFPEGKSVIDEADHAFAASDPGGTEQALHNFILPMPPHLQDAGTAAGQLQDTRIAQPAIGTVSKVMMKILSRFGVTPDVVCGHSFGELSALNAAGAIDDTTFFTLAAERGKHMAGAGKSGEDRGSMLAVNAPLPDIEKLIQDNGLDLIIANRNSVDQGVLSGPTPEIKRAVKICRKQKIRSVKLPVAAAFHSKLVADAARPFAQCLSRAELFMPEIPVMSNTKGTVYPESTDTIKDILGRQLISPVRFVDNIHKMLAMSVDTFVEVGPKPVLTGLVKSIPDAADVFAVAMDASGGRKPAVEDLAGVLCALASRGVAVELSSWEDPADEPVLQKMRISLTGANIKPSNSGLLTNNSQSHDPGHRQEITMKDSRQNLKEQPRQPLPEKQDPVAPEGAGRSSSDTSKLLIKGFEAMQELQSQTARVHEKFLETQAEASRTLQQMMAGTRSFLDPDLDRGKTADSRQVTDTPEPKASVELSDDEPEATAPVIDKDPAGADAVTADEAAAADKAAKDDKIRQQVLAIVSELTGFPPDMLDFSMDIESDLGIDSIKKVEIMSELEKKVPSSGSVTGEHLGSVRTLEDICRVIQPGSQDVLTEQGFVPAALEAGEEDSTDTGTGLSENVNTSDPLALLIRTVSDLTGFPVDMIEPGMNLESDLGIDSIKRVEILSRLEQELPDSLPLSTEDMAGLKTIQEISDCLKSQQVVRADETPNVAAQAAAPAAEKKAIDTPEEPLLRQVPVNRVYPVDQIRFYNGAEIEVDPGLKIYITKESSGFSKALKKAFKRKGLAAECIDVTGDRIPVLDDAAGLVIIPDCLKKTSDSARFLSTALALARENGKILEDAGRKKGAFFCTVSFMGGAFGFSGSQVEGDPVYGGLAGLSKTARAEWRNVLCRAMDMPADARVCIRNAEAAAALIMTQGAVEMGFDGTSCNIPELSVKPVTRQMPRLSRADVVVMTGGAKGVTAACAIEIARSFCPSIVLIGRSDPPCEEPAWLAGLESQAEIKKALLAERFYDMKVKPAELEAAFQSVMSNREIANTLEAVRAAGAIVRYVKADIRDKKQVKKVFEEIRSDYDNITAVIHGAGVLEDRLIVEKTAEQFARVFDTKVRGLFSLVESTRQDSLKYFVMFSSIAARMGNAGQADYAMANEVLNKTARQMADARSECRFLSINWGPWDGGMVNESLRKEFNKKGISLIDLSQGARQLLLEMGDARNDTVEVVIGASMTPETQKKPDYKTVIRQEANSESLMILSDHRIDSKPVVMFALLMEFMSHAALSGNPGLVCAGLEDMRLLKGVVADKKDLVLDVGTLKGRPVDAGYEVKTRITTAASPEQTVMHTGCRVILADSRPRSFELSLPRAMGTLRPYPLKIQDAYKRILFHGTGLQAIQAINGYGDKGIEVIACCSPSPEAWMRTPHRKQWVMDPLLLDSAFQAVILWCHAMTGHVCLPAYVKRLRLYDADPGPEEQVRIFVTVTESTRHRITADVYFVNENNLVIAEMTGAESVIDSSLLDKFKPQALFTRQQILAFAQGNPSDAFGDRYAVFDRDRQIARLPRPPYFFMDRVIRTEPLQWEMVPGGWIESEYDIRGNEWFFNANRTDTMPFCILLEAALQPCGWLAAYAGSALHSEDRLFFRNLGGRATFYESLTRGSGTIVVKSRMTDVSKAGGVIIQEFDMTVISNGKEIYAGHTSFGFFSGASLSRQVGIKDSELAMHELAPEAQKRAMTVTFSSQPPVTPDDETTGKNNGMPARAICMIDRIDALLTDDAGCYGNGYIRASKDIDPDEWFFNAHFYQDPVCPGSLGIESFLQTLRFFAMEKWSLQPDEWTVEMSQDHEHEWTYRGQITPESRKVSLDVHIRQADSQNCILIADGALSVDGTCIYEMKSFSIRMTRVTFPGRDQDALLSSAGRTCYNT